MSARPWHRLRTRPAAPAPSERCPGVVLLDVENASAPCTVAGMGALVAQARARVAGSGDPGKVVVVAACAESRVVIFGPLMSRLGVTLLPAGQGPSAADKVLIGVGAAVRAANPHVRVAVVSCDRAFAVMKPDFVVVTDFRSNHVAQKLRAACGEVVPVPVSSQASRRFRRAQAAGVVPLGVCSAGAPASAQAQAQASATGLRAAS